MKVVYRQTAPKEGCYGDCTADYAVEIDEPCTVGEFINWVSTEKSGEWGYIGISLSDANEWAGMCKVRCEYRWGKLLSRISEKYLNMKIRKITGHGGWSNMNYTIAVE